MWLLNPFRKYINDNMTQTRSVYYNSSMTFELPRSTRLPRLERVDFVWRRAARLHTKSTYRRVPGACLLEHVAFGVNAA